MSDFAPLLRAFRHASGLTQEALADQAAISVEAIRTLEGGRRRYPRASTIQALAAALGLSEAERASFREAAVRPKATSTAANQLPADLADFVGRSEQLDDLTQRLRSTAGARALVISAIAGMGGVGKTALAVHAAHQVTDGFPDGQFYLDLRGFGTAEPMSPLEALGVLLRRLGVPANLVPESIDLAAGRYRSAIAGRKMLLILDNAAGPAQVAPLLPGAGDSAVVITSRRLLTGLPGTFHLELEVLPHDEALQLLAATAGPERLAGDPAAVTEVIELCGGLPLALRIAGARLAARPGWSLADLRDRLADERGRLDLLADENLSVRASIGLSLRSPAEADEAAVALFPLLGLSEGPEVDLFVVSALAGRPEREIEPLLERLVDIHLLEAGEPGRYQLHDLVRSVARELADQQFDEQQQADARRRVIELYLATAWKFRRSLGLGEMSRSWLQEDWLAAARDIGGTDELIDWLEAERHNILAAARRAAAGPIETRRLVARLCSGVAPALVRRRRHLEWRDLVLVAIEAERTVKDPWAAAFMPFDLGTAYSLLDEPALAAEQYAAALEAPKTFGFQEHRQYCLMNLAEMLAKSGQEQLGLAKGREGLATALERADEIGEAEARLILGTIFGRLGRSEEQDKEFVRAAEIVRQLEPGSVKQWILQCIGVSYLETGRPVLALSHLDESADVDRQRGAEISLAENYLHQASALLDLGQADESAARLDLSLEVVVRFANQPLEAEVRHKLGLAFAALGRADEARTEWTAALDIYARYGRPQADDVQELLRSSS